MSIRGFVVLECDQQRRNCQKSIVLQAQDANLDNRKGGGLLVELAVNDWIQDGDGLIWCPQCSRVETRERGDDDGREYADPRDAKAERLS